MFRISILSNFTVLIILFNICCGPSSEKLEQRQGANLIMDYFIKNPYDIYYLLQLSINKFVVITRYNR